MLTTFVRVEVIALLIGLFLAVGYQAVSGKILVRGLFSDSASDGQVGVSRTQLLVFGIGQAGIYLGRTLATPHRLPDLPLGLVLAFAGSNAVYLGVKSRPLFRRLSKGG